MPGFDYAQPSGTQPSGNVTSRIERSRDAFYRHRQLGTRFLTGGLNVQNQKKDSGHKDE